MGARGGEAEAWKGTYKGRGNGRRGGPDKVRDGMGLLLRMTLGLI